MCCVAGGFPQSLPPDTSVGGELQIPPLIQPLMSVGGFPRIPPNVPPPPFPPAPLFRGGTLPPGFPPGFPLNMPPPPLLPLSGPPPSSSNSKSQPQSLMAGNPPWKSQAPPPSSQAPPTGPSHQLSMVRRELQKEIETYGVIDPMEREFGSVVKGLMESCTKDLISVSQMFSLSPSLSLSLSPSLTHSLIHACPHTYSRQRAGYSLIHTNLMDVQKLPSSS